MRKKCLITGVLGYVGTQICKIIDTTKYEVIGIDDKFNVERIPFLVSRGIKFYQRDIFNIGDLLRDCSYIVHLAGITDVAFTNTESDPQKDALIKKNGIDATRKILSEIPETCHVIFPSTHVVFESLTETTYNIKENFKPCPKLAYSTGKHQSEIDIQNSCKFFNILRLASVYGYNENLRIKIVGNLFAKMASQNEKIRLFGGGINYKPLVAINDVARFIIFLMENYNNQQIYHVVNENITVRKIAEICKEFNPKLEIEPTSDEIPNLGYTLSNEKMLRTGFELKYNIRDEIGDMIRKWSNQ